MVIWHLKFCQKVKILGVTLLSLGTHGYMAPEVLSKFIHIILQIDGRNGHTLHMSIQTDIPTDPNCIGNKNFVTKLYFSTAISGCPAGYLVI